VVGREDARANVYPKKPRPENKIDAAIAVIMGIARCMTAPGPSVYEKRGLLTLQ
jgi:phage terminase large subunit-like protein